MSRMVKLYSAEICPFAQRPRAVLTRLQVPFELVTVDLMDRDPEFLRISPTGKVPMLLDGELKLYESQVIIEYLAEVHGWQGALSPDLGLRARQRVAMKQWDSEVITTWYRSIQAPESFDERRRSRLEDELDELAGTVALMKAQVEKTWWRSTARPSGRGWTG